ncbi:MAG: LysR family transcriptional regulator [Acidobacteriaceae bacterium]|nr:LysR family transcriptional regulator [Acidobacteriaceae bacterium]
MTLANLRLIRDIAQLRSVTKAAQVNQISQSAASQVLTDLERELGITLFDRSTRPLTTTSAGKLYLNFCRDVLRRQEELQSELGVLRKKSNGVVRIAAIYSVGLSEMSQIEKRFRARFPEAELQNSYLRPERVWEAVEHGEADLGLMSYAESSREVIALPWRREEMVVAVGPQHPFARRKTVRPIQLEGEPFIGFDDNLPIQNHIQRYLREHKVNVEMALHFDNLQMIKEAVAHGAGISIMPRRIMLDDIQAGRLTGLRLEPNELFRPLYIIHRRRKTFNGVTIGLLALLREDERPTPPESTIYSLFA